MAEQRFLRSLQSAAAPPLTPNSNRNPNQLLVVLIVLSLCLSPFAHGQEPAVGSTNPPAADLSRRSRPRSHRTIESGDVGLQQGAYDRRHQADEQSLPAYRRKTGPNRNWTFRSEERRVGKECRSRWSP